MRPIAPSGPPSRDRCRTRYRSLVEPTSTGCSLASQTSRPCLRTQHRSCSPRNHAQLRPGALCVRCRLHTVDPSLLLRPTSFELVYRRAPLVVARLPAVRTCAQPVPSRRPPRAPGRVADLVQLPAALLPVARVMISFASLMCSRLRRACAAYPGERCVQWTGLRPRVGL
jgi:hypothetical protein